MNFRRFDHEHYLCCLLLPRSARAATISLRALNIELAQVSLCPHMKEDKTM